MRFRDATHEAVVAQLRGCFVTCWFPRSRVLGHPSEGGSIGY
jgi:hypothetical protein